MNIPTVRGKSTVENLVRSKNSQQDKDVNAKGLEEKDTTNFSFQLTGRYILLQNQLAALQNEYTREQTRLSMLENNNLADEELVNILYGGTPLFTESLQTLVEEKEALLAKIRAKKEEISQQIRSLEVESENILSIKANGKPEDIQKEDLPKVNMKPLDIKLVEKLIRG
jgi:hypothetical protein